MATAISMLFVGMQCLCLALAMQPWPKVKMIEDKPCEGEMCENAAHVHDQIKHLKHEVGELRMAMDAMQAGDHECHGDQCSMDHEDYCSPSPDMSKAQDGYHLEKYAGHYYYFAPKEMMFSWDEAHQYCQSFGMDMISLDSKDEYDIVSTAMINKGWVTQSDYEKYDSWTAGQKGTDGIWRWMSSGEPISHFEWYSGYKGKANACLGFGVYKGRPTPDFRAAIWDFPCSRKWHAICEYNHEECKHH